MADLALDSDWFWHCLFFSAFIRTVSNESWIYCLLDRVHYGILFLVVNNVSDIGFIIIDIMIYEV